MIVQWVTTDNTAGSFACDECGNVDPTGAVFVNAATIGIRLCSTCNGILATALAAPAQDPLDVPLPLVPVDVPAIPDPPLTPDGLPVPVSVDVTPVPLPPVPASPA